MRLKVSEDVHPITDFRLKSKAIVEQVRRSKRPVIITQRGRAAAVLEDIEEWERRLEKMELMEKIMRGIEAAERGEVVADEVVAEELEAVAHGKKTVQDFVDFVGAQRFGGGARVSARAQSRRRKKAGITNS